MKKLAFVLIALALPRLCWGQLVHFGATLSGWQETPPVDTPATGWAMATLDLSTLQFEYEHSFSGLLAPQTATHIHRAPLGVPGPVLLPLPLGSDVTYSTLITSEQAQDLLNGLWYTNIHSTLFPAGEIRGQLMPVPEPSTYAIAGVILLGGLAAARRIRGRSRNT